MSRWRYYESDALERLTEGLDERTYFDRLSRRIRQAREAKGLTQRQLGALLGVSGVAVCRWETAENRPNAWVIDRLERLLQTQVRP